MADIDEREAKIQAALSAARHAHVDRYGFDDVDETYIRDMPDAWLDLIINANKGGS